MGANIGNGKTPKDWPADEDRFHKTYADMDTVDSPFSITINERNQIPAGDGAHREPRRTNALRGFFGDDE